MPRIYPISVLRTRCQQRANMEHDPSIAPAEWNSLISEVWGESYEEVIDTGTRYSEYEESFTSTDGYIAEPSDQLSLVDTLELVIDATTGRLRRLYPVQAQERAMLSGRTGDPLRFELVDDRLYLYPKPPDGKAVTFRYIPQAPDLSGYADGEAVDVFNAAGEAFVIWGVAAIARSKDDRFVDFAEAQKEKARVRLRNWAINRAINEAQRIVVDDDQGVLDLRWEGAYR